MPTLFGGSPRVLAASGRSLSALCAFILAALSAACGSGNAPADDTAGGTSGGGSSSGAISLPAGCPVTTDTTLFPGADDLYALNQTLASYKDRPTGGSHHLAYYQWLKQQVESIAGLQFKETPYPINLWTPTTVALSAGPAGGAMSSVEPSGPVPYAHASPAGGAGGTLAYVPQGTDISQANAAGKIVLRDAETGSTPYYDLDLVSWWIFDPDLSLTLSATTNYERDAGGYDARIADLQDAASAGAAGLIFMHSFPRAQVAGHYAPYEGLRWAIPALYVGADEGAQLKQLAASGGSARIDLANTDLAETVNTLTATLPGQSAERIIIESHTDGMNAVWDNGPLVMVEMLRYFSQLPLDCRPKTLEFDFTTAHIYQQLFPPMRHGGAGQLARQLDDDYDQGGIDYVLALEHFGALEYQAQPRTDGGPGRELVQTGKSEVSTVFISDSPVLVADTLAVIGGRNLSRTIGLHGASLPVVGFPPFRDFGGEGTPYQEHALPTVAFITGPWSLYNPSFGIEAVDKKLMYQQALAYTDLLHLTAPLPQALLAGAVPAAVLARDAACSAGLPTTSDCPGSIIYPAP